MRRQVHLHPQAREQLYRLPTGTYQRGRDAILALGVDALTTMVPAEPQGQPVCEQLVVEGWAVLYEVAAGSGDVTVVGVVQEAGVDSRKLA
jgi:mRNA-degrading endonuclease RelE of RelBE toxin-antitoxin system